MVNVLGTLILMFCRERPPQVDVDCHWFERDVCVVLEIEAIPMRHLRRVLMVSGVRLRFSLSYCR